MNKNKKQPAPQIVLLNVDGKLVYAVVYPNGRVKHAWDGGKVQCVAWIKQGN